MVISKNRQRQLLMNAVVSDDIDEVDILLLTYYYKDKTLDEAFNIARSNGFYELASVIENEIVYRESEGEIERGDILFDAIRHDEINNVDTMLDIGDYTIHILKEGISLARQLGYQDIEDLLHDELEAKRIGLSGLNIE